jgi:hypothetical protein
MYKSSLNSMEPFERTPEPNQQAGDAFIRVPVSLTNLLRMYLLVFIGGFGCLTLLSTDAAPYTAERFTLSTVYILVATLPLWFGDQRIGLLHPLFVTSAMSLVRGITPNFTIFSLGFSKHVALPDLPADTISSIHLQVLTLQTLAVMCVYIGYACSRGNSWRAISFTEKKSLAYLAGGLTFSASIIATYLLVDLSGGIESHIKNITRGNSSKIWARDPEFASVYMSLVSLGVVAPTLIIIYKKRFHLNPIFWITAIAAIATGFLANGRRSGILLPILVMGSSWIMQRRSVPIIHTAAIVVGIFFSVGLIGEFRRSNWSDGDVNYDAFANFDISRGLSLSLEEMQSRRQSSPIYAIVALVPSKVDYTPSNYASYLYRFVPRLLWKDKPRGVGISCAEVFYGKYGSGGIPPGALGEAYWAGGLLGVVVVFTLWGSVLKSLSTFYLSFRRFWPASLIYLATVTILGPSEPQFRAWLFLILPTILAMIATRSVKKAVNT